MGYRRLSSWLNPFRARRGSPIRRTPTAKLALETFEDRTVPSSTILLNQVDPITQTPLTPSWTAVGPAPENHGGTPGNLPVSGRVAGIAVDPTDPARIFVAAASGGVWRTLDGGQTWTPLTLHLPGITDTQRTLNMGAIAIAPSAPNVVYAVEGEGDTGTPGFGVLKSTDGGDTWALTGTTTLAGISSHSIAVDNLDPNIVVLASESFGNGGIFRTLNGGTTWENISAGSAIFGGSTTFSDVDLAPRTTILQPVVAYCTVGDGGITGGIYRSNNANAPLAALVTWNLSIGGSTLVPGAGPGDIQLTISRQFPGTIYAGIASNAGGLLGVYRTTDSGANWTRILATPNYLGNQGDYDNVIAVSPLDPNVVVVAGQGQILVSRNATGAAPTFTDVSSVNGVGPHSDHHSGVYDSAGNYLDGDDGGIFRFNSPGSAAAANWESLNGNSASNPVVTALNTIQFVGISLHPRDPNLALGGSQDNGLARFDDNVGWTGTDTQADSGMVVYDYDNPLHAVHTFQFSAPTANSYMRYTNDGGLTWTVSTTLPSNTQTNPPDALFYPPIIIDPSNSQRYFFGSDEVSISEDGGVTWGTKYTFPNGQSQTIPGDPSTDVPPNMGGPIPITALGVGRASGGAGVIYAAHADGTLYQLVFFPPPATAPTQMDWFDISPTGAASVGAITQIIVDPQNPSTIYVVGPGGVARTQNALAFTTTWTKLNGPAGSGGLPGFFSADTIQLDPKNFSDPNDDVLYVGGTNGVYELDNPGHPGPGSPGGSEFAWTQVGGTYDSDPTSQTFRRGLPDVKISQLVLNTTTGILAAGTYGAGMWELQIRGLIRGEVFDDTDGDGVFDPGEPGQAGITVRLRDADTGLDVASAITDANGIYEFRSLSSSQLTASNYLLIEDAPTGSVQTTAPLTFTGLNERSTFDIADPNLNPATVAIGNFKLGSISGTKFDDRNGNGAKETTEPTLSPPDTFTIFIDSNNNGALDGSELSTTTGANGAWTFTNLGPAVIGGLVNPVTFNGTYLVREVVPAGWRQTTAPLPPITLQSGQNLTGELVGNIRTASISGTKFLDTNGNGVRDAGENGAGGFTIQLSGPGGPRTVVTAADGSYSFLSLAPGTYQVTEKATAGFTQTTAAPAPVTLTVTSQVSGINFGNFKNVVLSGSKFNDLNGNGAFDAGEPGVGGFTIQLVNAATNAVVASVNSTNSGAWSFTNIGPVPGGGSYVIREAPLAGWVQSTPLLAPFTPSSGTNQTSFQIGNFRSYAVSGTSYLDLNGNGVFDGSDRAGVGFLVQLKNSGGTVVASATSAADGTFTIPNVGPGTFTVVEASRSPFTLTEGAAGYVITGQSGTDVTGLNFGNLSRGIIVAGADAGGLPSVIVRDAASGVIKQTFNAYSPAFHGGVRVATGSFNGDGVPDIVTAAGPGGGPHIRVFDGATGAVLTEFYAYGAGFSGGVYIATGDVNGDGVTDIITGAGAGGGPHVRVFDGATGAVTREFYAYGAGFTGGVRVASADVDGDGFADIITAAGAGGGPHVEVFSGLTGGLIRSFYAYAPNFAGGVYVAAGDVNGDGTPDIITGPGEGGGPHLRVFDGTTNGVVLKETMAFSPGTPGSGGQFGTTSVWSSGLRVGVIDLNQDGAADIIVGPGRGQPPVIRVLDGRTFAGLLSPDITTVYDPSFLGGLFVAGS